MTVIVAPTRARAISYAAERHISRPTIITTAAQSRGRDLTGEEVLFTDPPTKYRHLLRLVFALEPAGVRFPGDFLKAAFGDHH